jgi:hypothetical protein
MDLNQITELYAAVYDQDLREEILSVEEDFEFIDDLSDNDLDQIMESILEEGEVSLSECVNAFDGVLTEATVTTSGERSSGARQSSATVTRSAGDVARSERMAERNSKRRKEVRVGRISQAVGRAAEKVKSGAKAGAEKLTGKLRSAKERIKGFVGRIGRAAKAGYSAAKGELTGGTSKARRSEYEAKKAARETSARASQAGAFNKPPRGQENRGKGVGTKERVSSGSAPSSPMPSSGSFSGSERRKAAAMKLAKAATGKTAKGIRFSGSQAGQAAPERASTGIKEKRAKFAQKLGLTNEQYDILINLLISEGYSNDYEEAMYVFESLDDTEIENLAETYLTEQTYDVYDVILEYLCTEGYADTLEDAETIMVNMSEDWRDTIVERVSVPRASSSTYRETTRRPTTNTYTGQPVDPDPNSPDEKAKRERREKRGKMAPVKFT